MVSRRKRNPVSRLVLAMSSSVCSDWLRAREPAEVLDERLHRFPGHCGLGSGVEREHRRSVGELARRRGGRIGERTLLADVGEEARRHPAAEGVDGERELRPARVLARDRERADEDVGLLRARLLREDDGGLGARLGRRFGERRRVPLAIAPKCFSMRAFASSTSTSPATTMNMFP